MKCVCASLICIFHYLTCHFCCMWMLCGIAPYCLQLVDVFSHGEVERRANLEWDPREMELWMSPRKVKEAPPRSLLLTCDLRSAWRVWFAWNSFFPVSSLDGVCAVEVVAGSYHSAALTGERVHVYVCVCMPVCVCVRVRVCTMNIVWLCVCVSVCCVCNVCMSLYMYVLVYNCTCVCACVRSMCVPCVCHI